MPEWRVVRTEVFARKLKKYQRKHRRETESVLENLDRYVVALDAARPRAIKRGFIHDEGQGLVAIAQTGLGKSAKETRLYVYAVELNKELHLITIGDKDSQRRDIAECRVYVKQLSEEH